MSKEIRPLTGIRGLAACWVVFYHDDLLYNTCHNFLKPVLDRGYLAVDLFFVLSGFVMALSYGHLAKSGWTRKNYIAFLIRRFARLYPLYILTTVVIAAVILVGLTKSPASQGYGWTMLANLTLTQSWGLTESINGPAWSISTELAAYLLFPILAAFTLTSRKPYAAALTVAICIGMLCCLQFMPMTPQNQYRVGPFDFAKARGTLWPLIRCISEFTIGLATYRLSLNKSVQNIFNKSVTPFIIVSAFILCLAIRNTDILVVLLIPPLLLNLKSGASFVARFVGSNIVFFLGEISYSTYLVHEQFLRFHHLGTARLAPALGDTAANTVSLGIMFSAVILFSWITYSLIEKPCRQKIRVLEEK